MEFLRVKRLAIGSRWVEEDSRKVQAYMEDGGVEVVKVTSRGPEHGDGSRLALDIAREVAEAAPTAEGILVPGGVTAEHTIVPTEQRYGKTVFTNFNTEVWNSLVRPGVIPPIQGWGRLLATPEPGAAV